MRKAFVFIVTMVIWSVCTPAMADKYYNQLLKSKDGELKYKAALEYYEKGDYKKTIRLLEDISTQYKGTEKSENILYLLSTSYFKRKDYIASAHYYQTYVNTYLRGKNYPECLFMLAYSEYLESPEPELDQRPTMKAIEHFQLFLEQFPYDEHAKEAKQMQTEMYDKLAEREYQNAKLYYNLGNYMGNNYLSCIITAQNALNDYPYTGYREDLSMLVLRARYSMAKESVEVKKIDRYRDTEDEYYAFKNEFPESKYMKEADKILRETQKALKK